MKTSTLRKHCLLSIGVLLTLAACTNGRHDAVNVAVAYVSEDQVFSEPILRDFERETGIRVQAVFDTEETKSTGVMNRLLAEKDNPRADVFWANEPIRAEYLKQQGIAPPTYLPTRRAFPITSRTPKAIGRASRPVQDPLSLIASSWGKSLSPSGTTLTRASEEKA